MVLQRFHQLDADSVGDMSADLRRLLESYDVTVVFSCISVLHDFVIVVLRSVLLLRRTRVSSRTWYRSSPTCCCAS